MNALFLIALSIILGLFGGKIFNKFKFPAVVGYIITGLLLGPSLLNILTINNVAHLGIISDLALGIVAFSIGNELRIAVLKKLGFGIFVIILAESLGAFFLVGIGVYLLTHKLYIALIFAALAPASAPAGTWLVLREYKAKGPLTNTILAVVGLDDGFAIILYGLASGIAKILIEQKESLAFSNVVFVPLLEIFYAIALGSMIGLLILYLLRKTRKREDSFTITLAGILACTGLANMLNLSIILSNMVFAVTMTNMFLLTSRKAIESVERITNPVYIAFFVLAGAHLQIDLLPKMGWLGLIYIVGRIIGLMGGAYTGASLVKADTNVRKYLGLAILSQAGVAVGLAILVGREFAPLGLAGKELALLAINTIAATTIIFELVGPLTTKFAILRSGEAGKRKR